MSRLPTASAQAAEVMPSLSSLSVPHNPLVLVPEAGADGGPGQGLTPAPLVVATTSVNRDINVRDSLRYFIAGNVAGMTGVLVGQPFDTLKVRMQTQGQVLSFAASASSSVHTVARGQFARNFPAPSYYQPPIFSAGSIAFGTPSGAFSNAFTTGTRSATTILPFPSAASTALFTSPLACLKATIRTAGLRGLYRGMSSPLLLVGCQKSVAFGVFGTVVQHLQQRQPLPTLEQVCIAGVAGGVANSLILTPVDQFKIAMQIQGYGSATQPSMLATARQLITEQGLVRGVYGNFRATLLREVPMYSIYYTLYSYLHRSFVVDHANRSRWTSTTADSSNPGLLTIGQKESLTKLLMGGLTGVGCWASCYPLDTIKSSMVTQTAQNIPADQRKNIRQMIRHMYNNGGVRPFYSGLTPGLMRAFPVHAVVFFTFSSVSDWLEKNDL